MKLNIAASYPCLGNAESGTFIRHFKGPIAHREASFS
jgi:hypothetical protein